MKFKNPVYRMAKEIDTVSDIKEIVRRLNSGAWVILDGYEENEQFTALMARII